MNTNVEKVSSIVLSTEWFKNAAHVQMYDDFHIMPGDYGKDMKKIREWMKTAGLEKATKQDVIDFCENNPQTWSILVKGKKQPISVKTLKGNSYIVEPKNGDTWGKLIVGWAGIDIIRPDNGIIGKIIDGSIIVGALVNKKREMNANIIDTVFYPFGKTKTGSIRIHKDRIFNIKMYEIDFLEDAILFTK